MTDILFYKQSDNYVLNHKEKILFSCRNSEEAIKAVDELNRIMNERIQYKKDLNNLKYRINQLIN